MAKTPEMSCELNMTPMIDVVFQLIIFFMLVTEMAQADLESMELPDASEAVPDDKPEKNRMVINVNKKGDIKIRGKKYNVPNLKNFLKREADLARDPKDNRLCTKALLIRADREAEFKYIQHIMQECVQPGVGIWRILIASKETQKE